MNRASRWLCRLVPLGLLALAGCASNPPAASAPSASAARVASFPVPDVPPGLRVAPDVLEQHMAAWQRLQSGDVKRATREFEGVLKLAPGFYPSTAGLGFASLAARQYKVASARFTAVTAVNDRYLPAWLGLAEAEVGLKNDEAAIAALERALVLDPRREAVKTRLDLVKFRQTQLLIDTGRRAASAGKLADAEADFERALALSPSSTMILRELIAVERVRGDVSAAEAHARRAVQLETGDAELHALLAALLEAQQKWREASTAYGRAVALDPRPEWRAKVAELRERADLAALPADFAQIPTAATLTRGQVAAFIGVKLDGLIGRAPRRVTAVATDIRGHWAATWILPVTRAGVMEIYANHTFQPGTTVRRGDLAQVVAELVALAARPADLARWRAAKPAVMDLTPTNVFYAPAAVAVASGAMTLDADRRFQPTRPASGPDLTAAVARVTALSGR